MKRGEDPLVLGLRRLHTRVRDRRRRGLVAAVDGLYKINPGYSDGRRRRLVLTETGDTVVEFLDDAVEDFHGGALVRELEQGLEAFLSEDFGALRDRRKERAKVGDIVLAEVFGKIQHGDDAVGFSLEARDVDGI